MVQFIKQIQQDLKYRNLDMPSHQPHLEFEMDHGNYLLKTATKQHELKEAFKLRYQMFYKECSYSLDVDAYDSLCDHLVIIDKRSQAVIGTYRLNPANHIDDFYSQTEFDLSGFIQPYKKYLELGRACIDQNHRNGVVISLLWKGIYYYMRQVKADILFGCTSIADINPRQAALVQMYLKEKGGINNQLNFEFNIKTQMSYKVPFFDDFTDSYKQLTSDQIIEAEKLVPALLKTYLKVGAYVATEPAYDSEMNTMDFFTYLNVENLADRYEKRLEKNVS